MNANFFFHNAIYSLWFLLYVIYEILQYISDCSIFSCIIIFQEFSPMRENLYEKQSMQPDKHSNVTLLDIRILQIEDKFCII